MRVGGTNLNNELKPLNLKPSSASETPEKTKVKDRATKLKAGLEGTGTLGTVEASGVAGNVAKTVNTSKPVETTGAAKIAALFDKTQVFTKTASTEGNFETSFGNQSLVLAAKRSDAEPLDVADIFGANSLHVLEANGKLAAAA